jgi:hypothetical protein
VEEQPLKELLQEAKSHENRLALHSESEIKSVSYKSDNPAFNDLLNWVKSFLPFDKYQRFRSLIKTPYITLGITNEIWTELERIFDGQNSFFNYEFKTTEQQADFNEYLQEIQDRHFFKTKGFNQLKYKINSVLIVDLPSEVTGDKLEPFYYFIDSSSIIDVKTCSKGNIKYIVFKISDKKIGVYDEECYRVYDDSTSVLTLVSESEHGLGYCPASFFWDKNLRKDNSFLKKSPVTDVLQLLDYYLTGYTFKEHADLYAPFPIVVSMEKLCNFEGCQDGFITKEQRQYYNDTDYDLIEVKVKCQSCESREIIGAGTNFEYPAKQSSDDPDLSSPVDVVTSDVKPLEYYDEKLKTIADKIKTTVIGTASKGIDNQAVNELQVLGSFESRRNVLITIKESFEKIHKFANDTVAKLRYNDSFVGSVVYYGDEFYLKNLATLQEEYKQAKENSEPDEEIDAIYRQIIQSKYKGNKDKIKRAWMLLNLNPMPHNSLEEAKALLDTGAVSDNDFIIKARFNAFISRFEREQTNIIFFGENEDFDKRISKIYEQLKMYADESKQLRADA